MKRDMQVIRKLILACETAAPGSTSDEFDLGQDVDVIDYHLRLMGEAGLVKVQASLGVCIFLSVTWEGHDFADACRDDVVWKKTIKQIKSRTQSVSFDVLLQLLKGTLTNVLLDE